MRFNSSSILPWLVLLAVAAGASSTSIAQQPLGGGTFSNRVLTETTFAGWTSPPGFALLVNFSGGLSSFVVNSCGNPAPGMQVTCTGRVLLSSASWNPSTGCPDCPVANITMQVDHIVSAGIGQLVWPVIVQGPTLYVGPSLAASALAWTPLSWTLPATSFCAVTGANALGLVTNCLSNPNFTCVGTPLSFGFIATVSSAALTTRTNCYDNFRVVLNCPAQFFTTPCANALCLSCGSVPPTIGSSGGLPTVPNPLFQVTIAGACPSSLVFLVLGLSDTAWAGGTLPVNLAPYGYPSCNLCVSLDVIYASITSAAGAASVSLPINNVPQYIGMKIFAQWVDFGPPPLALSDEATILLGP
jgi:hypothetical protein